MNRPADEDRQTEARETARGARRGAASGTPELIFKERYVVERELGRGGVGVVYLARDRQLHDKLVVIKLLLPVVENREWFRKKFLQEKKELAQLAYEKGRYILAAAQSYQAALEASKLGHGYLTCALVEEGLKTPAADVEPKDGSVLVREWFNYSTRRVPQMQQAKLDEGRDLRHEVFFAPGEEKKEPARRSLQPPRVFYRREAES